MTDTNYTPDEVRLLDELAGQCLRESWDQWENGEQDKVARYCYQTAAAMIAERRKRVPYTTVAEDPSQGSAQGLYTAPVAQPQPEQAGELTEEAVKAWHWEAQSVYPEKDDSLNLVHDDEIARAVALMREGLRAKRERDEARAMLADLREVHQIQVEAAEQWRRRAEKAEAALAEAQPVLDAVALNFDKPYEKWIADHNRVLQAYADRRRAEKGSS